MHHVVFVDRMDPGRAADVARVWDEHDRTGLPTRIGVIGRTLFHFNGLYVHLVESADHRGDELAGRIVAAGHDPDYVEVRDHLSRYLRPYSPECTGLLSTRATEFYRWRADEEGVR
jgi:cyclase